MNCPLESENSFDVLLDYSARKLDATRAALLEQHVKSCDDCAAFLMGQRELWQTMDVWEPEPVSLDFNRRLWQKIDAAAAAPWYRKVVESIRLGAWKPVLPLTAAVVLVAAGFIMDHPSSVPLSQSVSSTEGVSVLEADQVEKALDDIQLLGQLDTSSVAEQNNSTM